MPDNLIPFIGLIIWALVLAFNVFGLIVITNSLLKLLKKLRFPIWLNAPITFLIMAVISILCAYTHAYRLFDYYVYYFAPSHSIFV